MMYVNKLLKVYICGPSVVFIILLMLLCLLHKIWKHEHISIQQQLLLLVNDMAAHIGGEKNLCHYWGTKAAVYLDGFKMTQFEIDTSDLVPVY